MLSGHPHGIAPFTLMKNDHVRQHLRSIHVLSTHVLPELALLQRPRPRLLGEGVDHCRSIAIGHACMNGEADLDSGVDKIAPHSRFSPLFFFPHFIFCQLHQERRSLKSWKARANAKKTRKPPTKATRKGGRSSLYFR